MELSTLIFQFFILCSLLYPCQGRQQCLVHNGKCFYHVTLSSSECAEDNTDSEDQKQVNSIAEMTTAVLQMRSDYDQRIIELERTISSLLNRGEASHMHERPQRQGPLPDAEAIPEHDSKDHAENGLLQKLQAEFDALRQEIAARNRQVRELSQLLHKTRSDLNQTEIELLSTSKKLKDTEESLQNSHQENNALKQELVSTRADLREIKALLHRTSKELTTTKENLATCQTQRDQFENETKLCQRELWGVRISLKDLQMEHENLQTQFINKTIELSNTKIELMKCQQGQSKFCDFQGSELCGYHQDKQNDVFDWIIWREATPSAFTGPTNDHTCNNDRGSYAYVEATAKERGQNARLISPTYHGSGVQCIEFWYHMYGFHVGTLNVYTNVTGAEDNDTPKWRAYGNQGNYWSSARLTVPQEAAIQGYTITFEAILERGYQGDIAIDDISVLEGAC